MKSKRLLFILALLPATLAVLVFSTYAQGTGSWPELSVVTEGTDQVYPAISGSTVVWQDYRNKTGSIGTNCSTAQSCSKADIYALDLNGGTEQRLTAAPNGMDPAISGDTVVWRDWSTSKIVAHDLTDDSQQNVNLSTGQVATPAISGNIVVWVDSRNSTQYGDIYMRNLTQPTDAPVSLGSSLGSVNNKKKDKLNPAIDGNIVVWEDWRNAVQDPNGWWGNPDIYMKNLATGIEQSVCTNNKDQYNPVISGSRIFWQDSRNGNWDIYMYDVATAKETRLTTNFSEQSWPSVSGDMMAWKDKSTGVEDIRIRNLATGAEGIITADASSQKIPVISGDTLAWMDYRAGNWDIYRTTDDAPPVVTADGPAGILASTTTTITGSYSDSISGINPASASVTLDGSPVGGCTAGATSVSCPASGLAQGTHSYTISVSDQMGNSSSDASSFTIDSIAPAIAAPAPSGALATNSTTITVDYSDPAPGSGIATTSVSVTLDSNLLGSCTATATGVSCPVSGLAQGTHNYSVSVSDLAGNSSAAPGSFDIDSLAPTITATAPTGAIDTNNTVITAEYSDPAPGSGINTASVSVTLDGNLAGGCAVSVSGVSCPAAGVLNGTHNVALQVSDNLGNNTSFSWSFNVGEPPLISAIQPAPGAVVNNPFTAVGAAYASNGDGIDLASVKVFMDSAEVTGAATLASSSASWLPPGRLADGVHTAKVVVADLTGRLIEQTWSFTVTSPQLSLNASAIYWGSYAAYVDGVLSVDYQLGNPGTGACVTGQVASGTATNGVMPLGPLPALLGTIAPGANSSITMDYLVPPGVTRFVATSYASCDDDGGNTYWMPGMPPG